MVGTFTPFSCCEGSHPWRSLVKQVKLGPRCESSLALTRNTVTEALPALRQVFVDVSYLGTCPGSILAVHHRETAL